MKNKIILLMTFILVLSLVIIFFPNESKLETPDVVLQSLVKDFPGKEIFLNKMSLMGEKKRSYLFSFELDKELKNKQDYVLDKDVYLDLGLLLDNREISIDSIDRKKMFIYNNSSAFTLNNSSLYFNNIDFYITNTTFFAQSSDENSKVVFKNCNFFLYGKSVVELKVEKLSIEGSLFKKMDDFYFPESYLLRINTKDAEIFNSSFLDLKGATDSLVLFSQVPKVNIQGNFFISSLKNVSGLLSFSNSQIEKISNNYFEDINLAYKSLPLGSTSPPADDEEEFSGEELDAGVGIWTDQEIKPELLVNNIFNIKYVLFNIQNENFTKSTQEVIFSQINDKMQVNCKNLLINQLFILNSNSFFSCQ